VAAGRARRRRSDAVVGGRRPQHVADGHWVSSRPTVLSATVGCIDAPAPRAVLKATSGRRQGHQGQGGIHTSVCRASPAAASSATPGSTALERFSERGEGEETAPPPGDAPLP